MKKTHLQIWQSFSVPDLVRKMSKGICLHRRGATVAVLLKSPDVAALLPRGVCPASWQCRSRHRLPRHGSARQAIEMAGQDKGLEIGKAIELKDDL